MISEKHPMERLIEIGQRLHFRLNDYGIEALPGDIADALLMQTGGMTQDATCNGIEYLYEMRPLEELIAEVSALLGAYENLKHLIEEPEPIEPSELDHYLDVGLVLGAIGFVLWMLIS